MPVKIVERLGLPCAYRGVGTSGNIRWHSSLITINRRRSAARLPVLLTSGVAPAGGVRGGSHRTALRARRRATADRSADTQRAGPAVGARCGHAAVDTHHPKSRVDRSRLRTPRARKSDSRRRRCRQRRGAPRRQRRGGTVRLGITPPVVPVLAPHLAAALQSRAPDITLEVRRMWQPDLINAIAEGTVDVAITCGLLSEPPGVIGEVFCAETFMVALRTTHRFATRDSVSFADLAHDRLGFPNESLFPAWASAQRQALTNTAIAPPTVELTRATSVPSDGLSNPPSTGF